MPGAANYLSNASLQAINKELASAKSFDGSALAAGAAAAGGADQAAADEEAEKGKAGDPKSSAVAAGGAVAAAPPREVRARQLQAKVLAKVIFDNYICPNADYMVNIRSQTTREITRRIQEDVIDVNMFDEAQVEIYNLMRRDNFPRFKKSEEFRKLGDALSFYGSGAGDGGSPVRTVSERWAFKE